MRYEVVVGFNSKQLWVWDNDEEVYIDPPAKVLNSITDWREDSDKACAELLEIVLGKPDWLNEQDYWYDDAIDI